MSAMLPPVPALRAVMDPSIVSGPQDLYEIVRVEIARRISEELTIEQLLALDPYYDEHSASTSNERVRHELRGLSWHISETGMVKAALRRGMLHASVAYCLDKFEESLAVEQPGCSWRMVAAIIDRRVNTVVREAPFEGGSLSAEDVIRSVQGQRPADTIPVPIDRTVDYRPDEDPRCYIRVVYADIVKGSVVDPNEQHESGVSPAMSRYAVTRALRHASQGMRKHRAECSEVVKLGHPSLWGGAPSRPDAPAAGAPQGPPMPRPDETTDEVLRLRRGGDGHPPLPPQAIAKKLGLTMDEVRKRLRDEATHQSRGEDGDKS